MARGKISSGAAPSMHNVAAYAGVSIATVSKVMQGDPTVRAENVKSVQNAIEALGYRINPLAAELRRGRRKLIGAIVPDFEEPAMAHLISALEREAEQHGYALTAMSSRGSEPREVELINRMQDWRVAGLVIVPVGRTKSHAAVLLKNSGLATVFVASAPGDKSFDVVLADETAADAAIAARLHELGHRHILLLHREARPSAKSARLVALKQALVRIDKQVSVSLIDCGQANADLAHSIRQAFDRPDRSTAALALWPPAALLVIDEARRRGWVVPADLSLLCFEQQDWMTISEAPIGIVKQPIERMAARSVEFLLRRMDQPTAPAMFALESCDMAIDAALDHAPRSKLS